MLYTDQTQVDWTPSLVLKKKNSLKHAAKIHGGQSKLPEQRYLKMTVLVMLNASIYKPINKASFFSKNQPVTRN